MINIISFCNKWIQKFSDDGTTEYQVFEDMSFPHGCGEFGWEIDQGLSFKERYPCNSYEEALTYLPQVTEIHLLGNLLFSRWRYYNHWGFPGESGLSHKEWFIKVLARIRELADT